MNVASVVFTRRCFGDASNASFRSLVLLTCSGQIRGTADGIEWHSLSQSVVGLAAGVAHTD